MIAASSLSHFSTIVVLLVGILTIVGMLWKMVKTASKAVYLQLEATRENTRAIRELSKRLAKVEAVL